MDDMRKGAFAVGILTLLLASTAGGESAWITRGWAGYVVTAGGRSFTSVSGGWTQPRIVCNRPGSAVAFWIGLGGTRADSLALEQVGTSADCSERAVVAYSAWYQLFPAPPVELPLTIAPGDRLEASVRVDGWEISIALRNLSTGAAFSATAWMRDPETDSAEWIAEAPAVCFAECTPLPLADFRKVSFTDGSTAITAHAGAIADGAWSRRRLQIGSAPVAAATRLTRGGSSFSVVRSRSSLADQSGLR
jgi:Peptidase A4 family